MSAPKEKRKENERKIKWLNFALLIYKCSHNARFIVCEAVTLPWCIGSSTNRAINDVHISFCLTIEGMEGEIGALGGYDEARIARGVFAASSRFHRS